jgi:Flp pilus assembly secretin CpaC
MKNTIIHSLIKILLGYVYLIPFILTANNSAVNTILTKAAVEKQETELKFKYLLKKANDNFFEKKYKQAADQYLKAISILSNNYPKTDKNNKKITQIKRSLSLVYSSWAEQVLIEASVASETGKIEEAINLANQATEINHKLNPRVNRLKEKLNRKKIEFKFQKLSTDSKHNSKDTRKKYNISVLFEQGKILFSKNELNKSKDKFEEILIINPYNSKAIHYLNLINQKLYKDGQIRKNQINAQRIAETTWASVLPITSENFTGERIDFRSGEKLKISKKEERSSLEKMLNEIILPRIFFDDVPVADALIFIRDESVRLDPSGNGINLILKLDPAKATEEYNVTLEANNLPLKIAIRDICEDAGVSYEFKKYAVQVSSEAPLENVLITKVFPAEMEDFGTVLINAAITSSTAVDMKNYFIRRNVNFPENTDASVFYDFRISRLIARNTPEELEKIKKILEKLDAAVNPQVSIAAKFIEVNQTDFEELGFEWAAAKEGSNVSFPELSSATRNAYNNALGTREAEQPDRMLKFAITKNGWDISAMIHAMSQTEKTETLSSPRVTTLNGHTTVIRVVTERYFPTADGWSEPKIIETTANNATTTWFISAVPTFDTSTDIGIVLKVTPFVSSDNYTVDLILEPQIQTFIEYNEDYKYYITLPDGTNQPYDQPMPVIGNRSIKTKLRVYDGDTVVMGGALTDRTSKYNDKIPIMGDIPLLGRFFQSEVEDVEKINLLIFTTVRLIMPDGTPLRPAKKDGKARFPDKF